MLRTAVLVSFIWACSLPSSSALAQTVTSLVEGNNAGVVTSDPDGPSASAVSSGLSFSGTATIDFSGDGFGRAVQDPDGSGAVLVDALFANGQTGNFVEARTSWTSTATNGAAGPVDYSFDFVLTPPALRIADFAGLSETSFPRPDVFFSAVIRVDGVVAFEAEAHLIGGFVSHVLNESGTGLNPVPAGAGSVFGYDFSGLASTLDLGAVASGASVTVEYEMVARVDTGGNEAGGRAQFGDPFDLSGTPGFSGALGPSGTVAVGSSSWGQIKSQYD